MAFLLREFAGAPLGYWHDTGHAHHWEVMGWARQEDFLKALSDHLVGLHLHDARGPDDHLAPGTGEIDFALVARYLKEDALRVAEVHSPSDAQAYREGLELLRRLGF
jgi:sugar phosphate isomerase/epimerase